MAKILISSVGVGGRFKNQHISDREYQEACYKMVILHILKVDL